MTIQRESLVRELQQADYFIAMPEFNLTAQEQAFLFRYYLKNRDRDVYYIAKDGTHDGNIWNNQINLREIHFMNPKVSRLRAKWKAYYHLQQANTFVEPHKDEARFSVINIPIHNVDHAPTLWYKDFPRIDEAPLFRTHYENGQAYLLNVQRVHEVRNDSSDLRVMFQISLPYSFEDVCEKYSSGQLLSVES